MQREKGLWGCGAQACRRMGLASALPTGSTWWLTGWRGHCRLCQLGACAQRAADMKLLLMFAVSETGPIYQEKSQKWICMRYFLLLICFVLLEDKSLLPSAFQHTTLCPEHAWGTCLVYLHAGGCTTHNAWHTSLAPCCWLNPPSRGRYRRPSSCFLQASPHQQFPAVSTYKKPLFAKMLVLFEPVVLFFLFFKIVFIDDIPQISTTDDFWHRNTVM